MASNPSDTPRRRAKELLAAAKTEAARNKAIEKAMELGMPLHEIEEFLDWLDNQAPRRLRGQNHNRHRGQNRNSD